MVCARAVTSSRSITARRGDGSAARSFWWDEYLLNAHIRRLSPSRTWRSWTASSWAAVSESAAHGSIRVVTDTTKMGMPEVGIGFIPGRGRHLPPVASAGPARTARRPDGRAPFSGCRRHRDGLRRPLRAPRCAASARSPKAIVAYGVGRGRLPRHAIEPPASDCWSHSTTLDRRVLRRGDGASTSSPSCDGHDAGPGKRRGRPHRRPGLPSRFAVTLAAVRRAASYSTTLDRRFCNRNIRTSCGVVAFARSRGGHPRATGRQGPQAAKWSPSATAGIMLTRRTSRHTSQSADPDLTKSRVGGQSMSYETILVTREEPRRDHHAESAQGAQRPQYPGDDRTH